VNGTRLTPPKPILELEQQLDCWFDLSKTPISNQRLVIEEQWIGFSDELLNRTMKDGKSRLFTVIVTDSPFINENVQLGPIRILLGGYKNSGKTTMMRYLINKCLQKWNKILVLDLDIGQSEFSIQGCISAYIIDTPLLGPNFTHLTQPIK